MRYRLTLEQIMTTWYVTVTTWEPDGLTLVKTTKHYSFPVKVDRPDDLVLALSSLEMEMIQSGS
jgi:hypothetical protein